MARTATKGTMVAREACVITVGASPVEYQKVRTFVERTGEWVEVDNQLAEPVKPEDAGMTYVFKAFQKVPGNHPAVKDAPGCFMPLEDVDESEADFVTA